MAGSPATIVDVPTETSLSDRVAAAVAAFRSRADPLAISHLAVYGDTVLPLVTPRLNDPEATTGLAVIALAASLPGREAVALLTAALQQPRADVRRAALRVLSDYDSAALVRIGGDSLKRSLLTSSAASHDDGGPYLLLRWGRDESVHSFLRSSADDLIAPGQALSGMGPVPPASVIAFQANEDRWAIAVLAAAADTGQAWALSRLRPRLALNRPADLVALLSHIDSLTNPTLLRDLTGCLSNTTVCVETSVRGSVMVQTAAADKAEAIESPEYATAVKSYRICDIAALAFARKAHGDTGISKLDSLAASGATVDATSIRLSDDELSRVRRLLVGRFAP